jgi:hypothetical protein
MLFRKRLEAALKPTPILAMAAILQSSIGSTKMTGMMNGLLPKMQNKQG